MATYPTGNAERDDVMNNAVARRGRDVARGVLAVKSRTTAPTLAALGYFGGDSISAGSRSRLLDPLRGLGARTLQIETV